MIPVFLNDLRPTFLNCIEGGLRIGAFRHVAFPEIPFAGELLRIAEEHLAVREHAELVARVVILVRENAAVMTAMVEAKRLNNLEPFAVHIDIGRHGEFDRIDMVVSVTAQEERFAVEQNAIAVEFNFARAVGRFESVDSLRTDQRRSYSIKVG